MQWRPSASNSLWSSLLVMLKHVKYVAVRVTLRSCGSEMSYPSSFDTKWRRNVPNICKVSYVFWLCMFCTSKELITLKVKSHPLRVEPYRKESYVLVIFSFRQPHCWNTLFVQHVLLQVSALRQRSCNPGGFCQRSPILFLSCSFFPLILEELPDPSYIHSFSFYNEGCLLVFHIFLVKLPLEIW